MSSLSVVIIALNEGYRIHKCLASVRSIADEIIVVDSFSTDDTVEVCKTFGCKVISHAFEGFSQQKSFAFQQATGDWILSLDADEIVSSELSREIETIKTATESNVSAYLIPFTFLYLGRQMKYGGLGSQYKLRLFRADKGHMSPASVHEQILVEGKTGHLKGNVIHHSYRNLSHHMEKINSYTDRAAEGNIKNGKKYCKAWIPVKFPITFFTIYIIRGGILDGYPGFMWSYLAAVYGSLKIAKTIELNRKQ